MLPDTDGVAIKVSPKAAVNPASKLCEMANGQRRCNLTEALCPQRHRI